MVLVNQIVISVASENNIVNEVDSLKKALNLSVKMNSLVHEIQKERGSTADYIGSEGM